VPALDALARAIDQLADMSGTLPDKGAVPDQNTVPGQGTLPDQNTVSGQGAVPGQDRS
jgi:hypothetical protein